MKNINLSTELTKSISKSEYYSNDLFIRDAKDYIKAIKEGRMLCTIKSVSSSGMSRTIQFNSCEKSGKRFTYRQYWSMFKALGYKESKSYRDAFTINGCGMDMVFHTNYTIIHQLCRMGFITKKDCDILAQQKPTTL